MANVSIKFNNKEFLLSCEDGQEEHLEELLIQINQKFNELKNNLGNLGENKLLLITAVKIMDEYYETKKKVEQKKNELKDLSNKFRELKSLIYDYRDKKEEEIEGLEEEIEEMKDKKICTYCGTGYRGNIAADELIKGGFNAVTLEGGYSKWM